MSKPALASAFDIPDAFTIQSVRQENYRIKTFVFDRSLPCKPGQFIMLWIPGVNERPLSVYRSHPLSVSVASVGQFSEKLFHLKHGDRVGIRGPYGNAFELKGKNILLVGGGYGLVPLSFLVTEARKKRVRCTVVIGARKAADVILENEFKKLGCRVFVCTNDGSAGKKGLVTQIANELLSGERFSAVYGCGPEKMEAALVHVARAHRVPVYVSVERSMKCGFGICGACVIGDRLVCAHGTIFTGEELKSNPDFGKQYLDWSGKRKRY
ncbi:dihydroorotate dehydrogenase electron transfer subunit [Candidatus Micrarchaeota archaeon]|nr:dihydroorotate dehydrogenase electron transfer subunit [Candidatus Micrarchaeota archaeon]